LDYLEINGYTFLVCSLLLFHYIFIHRNSNEKEGGMKTKTKIEQKRAKRRLKSKEKRRKEKISKVLRRKREKKEHENHIHQ